MGNPLLNLKKHGQSVWYDNISRGMIVSGQLNSLIEDDGVCGMTSNPAIFEKAISSSDDYDETIGKLAADGHTPLQIYEHLAIEDIQAAADALAPVYKSTAGVDGYVSLEVSPYLADDTQGTLDEARRLAAAVDRPNLMIKVPGTAAGVPAVEQLIGEGLNINVTLLFSQENYAAVAEAYIAGVEKLASSGGDVSGAASVASFFISRIDALIDKQIEERLDEVDEGQADRLRGLLGKVAIANAKLAYRHYQDLVGGDRWQQLAGKGARPQRLLWASTGTKNPEYSDVLYVEELIGPDTVNTLPGATLEGFRDHGSVRDSLTESVEEAAAVMTALEESGISMEAATDKLQADAVRLFVEPFDKLLAAIQGQTGDITQAG